VGKHTDALGSFDTFQWGSTVPDEGEIDRGKLKRYIFNLLTDKAKAQDARDEAAEDVKKVQQELDTAKSEFAKGDTEGKIAGLERKLADAESKRDEVQASFDRLEVGIEKGLTPKQAARLQGKDRTELEKDADDLLETFGVQKATTNDDDDDDDDDEGDLEVRRQPRPVVNPGDPKPNSTGEIDFDKAAAQILDQRRF
jgi:hypothetical protein